MFDANLQKIYTSVVYYDQCDQIICAVFGNLQYNNQILPNSTKIAKEVQNFAKKLPKSY